MNKLFLKIKEKLSPEKRHNIFKLLPPNSIGAEIGVFKGDFSKLILKYAKPNRVHFIDVWWTLYGEYYPDWGEYTNYGKLSTYKAYDIFLNNIKPYKGNIDIQIHTGNDIDILNNFPDNYFDWVYIDSSHEYEHTYNELVLLDKKIKRDGIICGHDYVNDINHIHYGVKKAVHEFLIEYNYHLFYTDKFTQWAIKRNK